MQTHGIDLITLKKSFDALASRLSGAVADDPAERDPGNSPSLLTQAMDKVFELLEVIRKPATRGHGEDTEHDIHQLGDYAFNLLADLASIAGKQGMHELSHEFENLSLPFAVWIARQGGMLSTLEPIVNAVSHQANTLREPIALERLYEMTGEVQDAVTPSLQQDLEKTNPGRPWRILLLNRAIIATRSHNLELIEAAYDSLLERLPEEAPGFLREGMQQMVALNYPQPVRNLVEKYYNLWSVERTLH